MKKFVVMAVALIASVAAEAGSSGSFRIQSVPTLGEFAVAGLAIVVGVVGGKLVSKYRRK